jgi:diaminopimelate epimerase
MGETGVVIVRKLHGWGNDFLVALDADQPDGPLDASAMQALAPQLCDRRRGLGADGFIHGAVPTGDVNGNDRADVVMSLFNAGGGRAEMSGNGIRCLAHAVVLAGGQWRDQVVIDTDVGRRTLVLTGHRAAGTGNGSNHDTDADTDTDAVPTVVDVSVPMGPVTAGPQPVPGTDLDAVLGGRRHGLFDVGNPHVVVEVDDPDLVVLDEFGPVVEALFASGINVEVVSGTSAGAVDMRVWERGVGLTEACGTGACATAMAAAQWGLAADECAVRMPGGTALVTLVDGAATLTGPSQFVATVEVPGW